MKSLKYEREGAQGIGDLYPEHQEYINYPVQRLPKTKLRTIWIQKLIRLYDSNKFLDIYKVKQADNYFHITYISFTSVLSVTAPQNIQLYSGSEKLGPVIVALALGDTERIIPDKVPLISRQPGDDLRVYLTGSATYIDVLAIGWESPIRYESRYPIR